MKRIISTLLFVLVIVSAFCLTAFAADDFVKEKEFTIASYNGVNTFVGNENKLADFEDSVYWLTDKKDAFNIKYVSFVGKLANACEDSYASVVTGQGKTSAELISMSLANTTWRKQYQNLYNATSILKESGLPMGVSGYPTDHISNGFSRENLMAEFLSLDKIMPDDAFFDAFDDNNYVTYINNNGVNYMVFQLELYPRTAVLDWFNSTIKANLDKYAIVYTTSFLDSAGAMYTMWDWDKGFTFEGTTYLKSCNMTWNDKPRDGQGIWDYAFSNCDNLLAVVSSYSNTGADIVTTKLTTKNGYDVAAAFANADNGMNTSGPTVLLTKISEDNKEITFAWVTAFGEVNTKGAKTVKLDKIGTLAESLVDNTLPKIAPQSNGTNKAYIFGYAGNTFRPNANMTRAEACTIFARLILGVQDIPSGYTTRFEDVKEGDWFYNAVAYLDETGYFFRNKNTTYKPNEPITRAEFVDLANATSKLKGATEVAFNDVPEDHFYYHSIIAAASSGLVNGYEDGTFRPDNTITRAEVVTVINRLLGLKATERAISFEHLDNEFVDIGTHWARLNILMASNSNVHTDHYYSASLEGVTVKGSDIIFANKHFSFTVNKKNGKVTNITNLYTGEDINSNASSPQFIYIVNASGAKVLPSSLEIENNAIKVTFKNGVVVYLLVEIKDNFMTFEIDSELPASAKAVTFANLMTKLPKASDDDDFMLNGIAMSYWTNPVNKGYRLTANSVIAHAYSQYAAGTTGAKMGVLFSKKSDAIPFLQELTDAIDPAVGLTSKAGGAYAREWEGNFGDYIITTNVNPELLDANLALAKEFDVDQYDIHQGGNTFRQGDFWFYFTESGTAKEYYEKIGSKIADAGIKTGLHTYAYYVAYNAEGITADPKWQKDLETLETYTLRKKMTKFTRNAATVEDASDFDMTMTFFYKNSRYIMIDQEIMLVGATSPSGLLNLTRGTCGTKAADHAIGSKIYHLSGYFNMFVPKLGSDLFFHIADLTAKAYNEGGFDMIYLDAIDGLGRHLPAGHETWYYFHEFVHRIVSQCERTPIVETSSGAPSEWNIRGRCGAWDTANRSIKKMIGEHLKANMSAMNNNQVTTLGWFDFFPDSNPTAGMKNTMQKTIFHDDFDALGMGALLYDTSIVINPFSPAIKDNPYLYDNIKYYTDLYTKLRKSHYFTEETIEKVKSIGGEWKVYEKNPGEYAFLQMYYNANNLTFASDYTIDSVSGSNPFTTQTPFIRIESRYSTLFENPVTVYDFKEAKAGALTVGLSSPIDMTKNMAMTLRVKGTGNDGDAILLSMTGGTTSGESGGRADYFIDLNFEGWRDVILLDLDSAEYDTQKYVFSGIGTTGMQYATYRTVANYGSIGTVYIRVTGSTVANAQIGELKAYTQTEAPIKNPTVTVGSSSMTFNCDMKGGEYVEYDPLTGKATLYHSAEQTKEEITFSGKLNVASGMFTAKYAAEKQSDAPLRARVVLGFSGQEITN